MYLDDYESNDRLEKSQYYYYYWLAPRAGKMNLIARCDWLPGRARWGDLARLGLPAVSRLKNILENQIINLLLTTLFRSRWLDIGLVLFSEFMDLDLANIQPS